MRVLPAALLAVLSGWLWPGPSASYEVALLVLVAVSPELDRIAAAFSPRAGARLHRWVAGSIPLQLVWAAALAWAAHQLDPRFSVGTSAVLAGIGAAARAFVDVTSPVGLTFARRRFALGVLTPHDVVLVGTPVLALGVGAAWPEARFTVALGTWLFLLYAVALRFQMRRKARALGTTVLGQKPTGVYPTPWSPFRWVAVARQDAKFAVADIDVGRGKPGPVRHVPTPASEGAADAFTDAGAVLCEPPAGSWIVDLRFSYAWPIVAVGLSRAKDGHVDRIRLP